MTDTPSDPEPIAAEPESSPAASVTLSLPGTSEPPPFWRRIVAFIIDCLILGTAGVIVGFLASDILAALGAWGRVVGGLIGVAYFGFGASSPRRGQTPGKRLMSIAVRRRDGSTLTPASAFGRATLLMIPVACNGLALGMQSQVFTTVVGTIVIFLGGAILYFFLFNRKTRESAHDLFTRSVVMRIEADHARSISATIWPRHFVIYGAICLALIVVLVAGFLVPDWGDFPVIIAQQQKIAHVARTENVSVSQGLAWDHSGRSSWVRITAMTYTHRRYPERLANAMAATALRVIPAAQGRSNIIVVVSEGYDIVFASSTRSQSWSGDPADWRKRISDTAGLPID
jgi:uncharacterized RDD family membrane protein YckC